jgi:hypothetical protein
MTEEERRRCCLLGGCGCSPGSAAQRAAFKSWLAECLLEEGMPGRTHGPGSDLDGVIDGWLDKLFGTPLADVQPLPPAAAEGAASVVAPIAPSLPAEEETVTTGDLEPDDATA